MTHLSQVTNDMMRLRRELRSGGVHVDDLLRICWWRPVVHALFDVTLALGCAFALLEGGSWLLPLCLLVVGNRQRALGNLLHEAAHRNLSRSTRLNDGLATGLLVPLLLIDLVRYRADHGRHHLMLGDQQRDPDLLVPVGVPCGAWRDSYMRLLTDPKQLWLSLGPQLSERSGLRCGAYMLLWWMTATAVLVWLAGRDFAVIFVALWFTAKATAFHGISMWRELCDHFGLQPGGVFSYTRDIRASGLLRWLVHPRNDCYHLTHHLLPTVPYYRLRAAQACFSRTQIYSSQAWVCDSYFTGAAPVVGKTPRMQPAI